MRRPDQSQVQPWGRLASVSSRPLMAEPDPRRIRLAELRQRLEALGLQVNATPVGSDERNRLAEQFGEVLGSVLALAEELEAR